MRFFIVLFTILGLSVNAQVTLRITSLPTNTPVNPHLFAAGTFNNWNPGDSAYLFTKAGNNYELILPVGTGGAQYKITQGSWAKVEGSITGAQVGNRSFTYAPNLIVDITVNGWEGMTTLTSTALSNVKIISDSFYIPQLNKTRRVWIYLPNDYTSQPQKRYPVLYMQDGQNVFDVITSYAGEWEADETLSGKQTNGDKGCIVVAVDHGGTSRIDEYSPYNNPKYGGGQGEAYCDFIAHTLKHYIDSAYRTKSEREFTAIAGSSVGGLISFYTAVTYPEIFSKAGIFSPSFWFSDTLYAYVENQPKNGSMKFYFMSGTTESQDMVTDMEHMIDLLKTKGYTDAELKLVTKEDGQHSEWFWKREFGDCYDWLFDGITTGVVSQSKGKTVFQVYPNPAGDSFYISSQSSLVRAFNIEGKEVGIWENVKANVPIDISHLPQGNYLLKIKTVSGYMEKKLLVH
ncbi:MAG: alpha/beta hydrolase-fold protein [Bacteroidota bacterium]